jgi:hypothetical protein
LLRWRVATAADKVLRGNIGHSFRGCSSGQRAVAGYFAGTEYARPWLQCPRSQLVSTSESNPATDLVGVVVESLAELPTHLCLLERDMDPVAIAKTTKGTANIGSDPTQNAMPTVNITSPRYIGFRVIRNGPLTTSLLFVSISLLCLHVRRFHQPLLSRGTECLGNAQRSPIVFGRQRRRFVKRQTLRFQPSTSALPD